VIQEEGVNAFYGSKARVGKLELVPGMKSLRLDKRKKGFNITN